MSTKMRLRELLEYDDIVIQCHNNPDADAISSGFALYTYLQQKEKKVRLIYGGLGKIRKSNLRLMVEELKIPIEYVQQLEAPQLLITVDCQYGEGNVEFFEAENIAIIDHHQLAVHLPKLYEIRSNIGACATIVWDLLREEGIDVNENKNLATALYYGLLTDTNNFAEVSHPLDKDLRDSLKYDRYFINRFCNANLSLQELSIAGKALINYHYDEVYHYAIVEADPCDPNILGMISDLLLEVDVVDTCLVYSILFNGLKLSVRSCVREVQASELVQYITRGVGSGGGHLEKAGGFIQNELLKCTNEEVKDFLDGRMHDYFSTVEIIYAKDYYADLSCMGMYRKRVLSLGYVKATDLFPSGTQVNIRTLEGDLDIEIQEDTYIMIGIQGEIYPIQRDKFERSYRTVEEPYVFEGEYEPIIRELAEGGSTSIVPHAKSCVTTGEVIIYAGQLSQRVKIFTLWNEEKYMVGEKGDFLAVRKDDMQDVYIIEKNIFFKTYERIEEQEQ